MLLCLEHRYYGGAAFDAVPSFQKEHLRFLSSRQALRDAVAFQSYAEQRLELTGPWITFGGSYSGALAAWARKLYPKSFFAAVSSSAPIQNQLHFKGYHDVVASNLASASLGGSVECLRIVASGHRSASAAALSPKRLRFGPFGGLRAWPKALRVQVQALWPPGAGGCRQPGGLGGLRSGSAELRSAFSEGKRPFWTSSELGFEAQAPRNSFLKRSEVIVSNQYNSDRCEVTSCNVRLLCGNLTEIRQKVENDLDALMLMNDYQRQELVAKGTALSECQDVSWGHYLDGLKVTEKRSDSSNQMGLWTYQICTEFGNFMTCEEGSNCPWTQGFLGMKLWFDMCDYAFGITKAEVEAKVAETNRHYGGTAFEATRVVFTNGAADPWHWLSVLVHPHQDVETLFVQGASHCQWMQAPWASMPEQHRAVQLAIQNKIAQWLQA